MDLKLMVSSSEQEDVSGKQNLVATVMLLDTVYDLSAVERTVRPASQSH